MKPVLTVEEMRQVDSAALATVSESTLVERAGTAVATQALAQMGGAYGRRVVVLIGPGNNGADGLVAARRLRERGARVKVYELGDAPDSIGGAGSVDLVIDAVFGTGFRGEYKAPSVWEGTSILAVDIPSGVKGNTGEMCGDSLRADVTVTFAALKPGLMLGDGPLLAGDVRVVDIGLPVDSASISLVEDSDVVSSLPPRGRDAHKWNSAVAVVAGSPGMKGAASLCALAALRSGSGMVRLGIPGADPEAMPAAEAVGTALPRRGWASDALRMAERCRAIVIGPGLGRDGQTRGEVRKVVAGSPVPVLVDADALFALGDIAGAAEVIGAAPSGRATILTPHSGEFASLVGRPPAVDRIADVRALAADIGAIVLLKGPTTVVSDPDGSVLLAAAGGPRLATAGTGDVLSGVIGSFLARGVPPLMAAGLGAHVHGAAAALGFDEGMVASDLAELLPRWLSAVRT